MLSFWDASASSGLTLSRMSRSIRGFVSWMLPRKFDPTEAWSRTGRWPPIRRIAQDSRRVSPSYRPRPRPSAWMSPNWSVSRYMSPCFRTWTLPRSVAFSIERGTGSRNRNAPGTRSTPCVCCLCVLRQLPEAIRLVRHREGVDERIDPALQHRRDVVDRQADAVIGHPVVGEVVGPDLLRPFATADHAAPFRALSFALLLKLEVVEPGAEDRHRLRLVLVLALLVLDLDHETRREVGDPNSRVRRVDRLTSRPRRSLDLDAEVTVLVDVDLELVSLRHHAHGGGRRVDAARRLRRRHPLDTVYAAFVLEPRVRAVPVALDDRLLH